MPLHAIPAATAPYERSSGVYTPLVADDLARNHARVRGGPFVFLRATFYRRATWWPRRCPEIAAHPRAPSVGDLRVENFGTWREARA